MTNVGFCDAGTWIYDLWPTICLGAHVQNLLYSFSLGDGLPFISIFKSYARLQRQHITLSQSLSKYLEFWYISILENGVSIWYHIIFILIHIDTCVSITVLETRPHWPRFQGQKVKSQWGQCPTMSFHPLLPDSSYDVVVCEAQCSRPSHQVCCTHNTVLGEKGGKTSYILAFAFLMN